MCKGTINMEEYQLIKVDHLHSDTIGKLANPQWIKSFGGIPVDKCIADEIQYLIDEGVVTVGCCCGHGNQNAEALVLIESKSILNQLGYDLYSYSDLHNTMGIYAIKLRTGD